ncbi:TPA: hypothetical protein DHW58_01500 [Patescibacteria group bacterium]|nr:hypothetical protein [Patescibacteria group bacterium]HCL47646.1 hypothetical protein [Patescibacteria group bacterium]HCR42357.1 hypothetical protein [Patescibacteria group bacterium]
MTPTRGLTRSATSFFGHFSQGIHRMPLSNLHALLSQETSALHFRSTIQENHRLLGSSAICQ